MQVLCSWLAALGLVVGVWEPGIVAAQEAEPSPATESPSTNDRLITMDFQDVDLGVLVKFISEITGRNFIVDDRVKGKVTIISPAKISVDEAYTVFQSVLQVKGFTTVPSGSITKIIPAQDAKSSTVETVFPGGVTALSDEFITRMMPLHNVDVNNMLAIIQPLVSSNGLLAAYAATNTLIIIDSAANIARIARILQELDVEGMERRVEVIRLNYAFAVEIAATLAQVLQETPAAQPAIAKRSSTSRTKRRATTSRRTGTQAQTSTVTAGGGEAAFKIIPDERTNSLIVVAGPLDVRRIKDLIMRLDVPLPFGTGRIHVYYLKYANAFEIVPVLSDLIGGTGGIGGFGGGLLTRGIRGSTATRGGRLGQRGGFGGGLGGGLGGLGGGLGVLGNLGSRTGSRAQRGFGGASGSLRGASGPRGAPGVTSVSGGGSGEFEGQVRITADPSTNALIINASPQDFETLKRVIEQIDVRRRQVYVEAIIMEVTLDTRRDLGIELQGGVGLGKGIGFGRTNFAKINQLANPLGIGGLILAAASNQTVRLPDGTSVPAQQALISAAQVNNDVNILSAPNILTTDNQEAEIVVGENVPFLASRSSSETNLSNTFATIERRDVGITLRITPQISEGGLVRLDIFQEVSKVVLGAVDASLLGPTTTIRSATTSVVVRNRQTVVIGGLISDDTNNTRQSVPILSQIPLLGNFLRNSFSEQRKKNLLIFLTPHIIRDASDHRDLSTRRRDEMKAFMEEHRFRNRRRQQLDRPSWEPDIEESPEPDGEESYPSISTNPGAASPTRNPRDLDPPVDNRYVLLAGFAERGTPPPSLQSGSGLLALALPVDSTLTELFQKGGRYRFSSDTFEGLYQCLEAYPTALQAQLIYPEGLPVDPSTGEFLHWRDLEDASSSNVAAWSALQ